MAFIFPEDKATFTAPNGITYAWKDDHWVVQKFKGDHEVYVSPTPPDNPSEGKLWYDSSGDVIELFIYVDGKWVSATPNSEYALETRIAANEQGIRDLWADQNRQDFEIAALDTRVDALEGVVGQYKYIIQTANPTPRDGQLAFLKGDMSTTTRWGDATNIAVNPTSGSGDVWPTDEIVTGDVLRFHLVGDITMDVSAFEAKVVQNNNNLFSIDHVVKEVGTIMDGAEYEVFHLSSFDPSGLATMDYVDAQDSNLKNYTDGQIADLQSQIDSVDGEYLTKEGQQDLDSAAWKIRQPNLDGAFRSFINIHNGDMNLYNVVTPTGSGHEKWAANKEYADKKVAKTGGTMTGDLNLDGADRAINIENGNRFRLKAKDADGDGRTFVDIQTTDHDGPEAQDAGYRIRIYHLADPTSEYHAANRKYVDDAIASIDTNINLDNYLPLVGGDMTGRIDITLADQSLAAIRTIGSINVKADGQQIGGSNSFIAHKDYVRVYATPVNVADVVNREWSLHNGMRWTHVDDADAGNLAAGEFFVASNGNIYMHGVSKDGIDIAPGSTATEEAGLKFFCSVHRSNGDSAYFITTDKVAFNQGSNKYIRIEKLHAHLGDSTTVGQTYRLNIPGFTY